MSRLAEVKWKARDVNRTIAFTIRRRPARYLGAVLLFLAGTEASAAVAFSSPVAAWVAVACAIAAAILLSADSAQLRKRLRQRPPDEEASITVPDGLIPQARAECPRQRTCCATAPGRSHAGTCPNSIMRSGEERWHANELPQAPEEWPQ